MLNVSGNIISNSPSFTQFDPDQEGTLSEYMEGLYTLSNISLDNDGETIQFLAYGTDGGTPDYSVIATLNVQGKSIIIICMHDVRVISLLFLGPPGPVSKLSCHFLTQDVVQVSYNEPQSLVGVETKYLIALPGLSANTITTDGNTVNVTLPNITALDVFKSYNITVTSFNSGSVGNTSSCTIFIPNGKCLRNYTRLLLYASSDHYLATQIASSVISVVLFNDSKYAKINVTTELLDTKVHDLLLYNSTQLCDLQDSPLCPGCYPDAVSMFVKTLPKGHIRQYEPSVPAGEIKFYMGNISVQKNAQLNVVIYYCNVAECVMKQMEELSKFIHEGIFPGEFLFAD